MLPLEHSAIFLTFIKLSFAIKTFVFSSFEWLLKTGFTVAWFQSSIFWHLFSNANILKKKRIKVYHIKGIGCPLLISINIDAWGHP